jgi:hypothetical protein
MKRVISISYPSPPRKRGSRPAPGKEQGATAKALGPWVPAFEAVIQLANLAPRFISDELASLRDFLTASFAGMTNNRLVLRNSFSFGL